MGYVVRRRQFHLQMKTATDEYISTKMQAGRSIREIAAVFLEFGSDMFASLGNRPSATTIETFHELGELRVNMSKTGFYGLRNDDLFYWVLLKGSHRSMPDELITLEFEAQLAKAQQPLFQANGSRSVTGAGALSKSDAPLETIQIMIAGNFAAELDKVLIDLKTALRDSESIPRDD